jgi:hypothetical protein
VALIGAIVIAGLASTFLANVEADSRIADEVAQQVGVAVDSNVEFVSSEQVAEATQMAGLDPATATAIVEDYEDAQLQALKTGLLVAAAVALLALMFTGSLPGRRPGESQATLGLATGEPGG